MRFRAANEHAAQRLQKHGVMLMVRQIADRLLHFGGEHRVIEIHVSIGRRADDHVYSRIFGTGKICCRLLHG